MKLILTIALSALALSACTTYSQTANNIGGPYCHGAVASPGSRLKTPCGEGPSIGFDLANGAEAAQGNM